jgi:uncharacterized protein DUF551
MNWVSVKNELPPQYDYVLIFVSNPGTNERCPIGIARHDGDVWQPLEDNIGACMDGSWVYEIKRISHWMPLPNPPRA